MNPKSENTSVHYKVELIAGGTDDNVIIDNDILKKSDIETEAVEEKRRKKGGNGPCYFMVCTVRFIVKNLV